MLLVILFVAGVVGWWVGSIEELSVWWAIFGGVVAGILISRLAS